MPPDPPDPADLDRTENAHLPAAESGDAGHDTLWIRVGPARASRQAGGNHPMTATVSDIESELDALDLEVVALPADTTAHGRDLQRVVDRYERILEARERASRDRRAGRVTGPDGLLGTVRARIHDFAADVRR